MLERFKVLFSQIDIWAWILAFSLEAILRIAMVVLWNWTFSKELNLFLFNDISLGYWKGFVLISVLIYIFTPQKISSQITNNQYNKEAR